MRMAIDAPGAKFTATVRAADGVRFVIVSPCAHEIARSLVEYVRARCDDVLWPEPARDVHALIAAHQSYAAIAAYFEHVGERWDEESLELSLISGGPADDGPPEWGFCDELRSRPASGVNDLIAWAISRKSSLRPHTDGAGIRPMTVCAAIPNASNSLSLPGSASSSSPTGNP
jgi:hypothetical protein